MVKKATKVKVTAEEAPKKAPKRKPRTPKVCPQCNGTGLNADDFSQLCDNCGGTGTI